MLLEEDADDEPPPKTPDDRLERWKRRLLDISGRNRLLNLPIRGKRALRIDCPDLSHLAGRLLETRGGRKPASFRFHPRPDLMTGTDPRSARLHLDRLQEDAFRAYALKALDKGELLVALDEQELPAVLTEIYRAARTAQQEGGANTLFLTLGALRWRQKDKEKPYHAPIVLVPVVLDRPSVRSGFYLRARDDEVQVNFTLLEMLRQDFAIQIPEIEAMLPVEGDGTVDVKGVLDVFRRKLRDVPGWEVTEEAVLTNLSFAKYLMWKDLTDHAEVFRQNEIVRLLLQGSPAGLEGSKAGPSAREAGVEPAASSQFRDDAGGRLDDELAALDLVCPLEADSSQLRAIAAAAQGKSFVLIGPPGTGKSQTIANIIATSLAQGRTVLFVAEKRAALEVVQKRLKDVELADFCLDLFSAKASKTDVLKQLGQARQAQENFDLGEWQRTHYDIKTLKHELNDYVRELHHPHRNGWTAYRAIGCLLRAEERGIPKIQLNWPNADTHNRDDYRRLVETLEEAAKVTAALGDLASHAPLAGIERSEWSPTWQANLISATDDAAAALRELGEAATQAVHALALPPDLPLTPTFLRALVALIDLILDPVLDPAASDAAWALAEANLHEVRQTLAAASSVAAEHAQLAGGLEAEWGEAVRDLPLGDLLTEWLAAKDRWFPVRVYRHRSVRARLAPAAKQRVPKDPSWDLETLIVMRTKEAEFDRIGERLAPILGTRWQGLQTDFGRLDAAIGMAMRLRAPTAGCISDPVTLLALRTHLRRVLGDGLDLLGETGPVGAPLRRLTRALVAANDALANLAPLCWEDPGAIIPPSRPDWPQALARHLEGWVENKLRLRDWCTWRSIRKQAETLGLAPLIAAIEHGTIGSTAAREVFEANYVRWWPPSPWRTCRGYGLSRHHGTSSGLNVFASSIEPSSLSARLVRARLAARIRDALGTMDAEDLILTRELKKTPAPPPDPSALQPVAGSDPTPHPLPDDKPPFGPAISSGQLVAFRSRDI